MTNENVQTPPTQPTGPTESAQPTGIPPKPGPSGKAVAALILGILSLICCGFFAGIPAIIVGKQEMNDIDKGISNMEGRTLAQIGFILGIIGTALFCIGLLLGGLFMILGVSAGVMEGIHEGSYIL